MNRHKQPHQALAGGAVFSLFYGQLLRFPFLPRRLGRLADRDRGDSQGQDGQPLGQAHGDHGEHPLEGRDEQHGQLHGQPHQKGLVHGGVGKDPLGEEGAVLAADVEGVEELAQGQGGEGRSEERRVGKECRL